MTWREAVELSSIRTAERDCSANEREPWQVVVRTTAKGYVRTIVYAGRRRLRGRLLGVTTVLSTKRASQFDDWVPVRPKPPLVQLAIMASWS